MMEKLIKKLNNRKGFTLIELIVVIAIIGILAAILIPQFTGFSDKAEKKAALSEARSAVTALTALNAEGSTLTGEQAKDAVVSLSGITADRISDVDIPALELTYKSNTTPVWTVTYDSGTWGGNAMDK